MAHFTDSQSPYFIMDSAGYTENNIQEWSGKIKQVSRPPATIWEVQSLYQQIEPEYMEPASQPGYAYAEVGCIYGGINQRWLVIYSEKAYRREIKTLNRRIWKEREKALKNCRVFQNKEFDSESEARPALKKSQAEQHFHPVVVESVTTVCHYHGKGRPKACQLPDRTAYRLNVKLIQDEVVIEAAQKTKGKFIVAANELDTESLSDEKLLEAYKDGCSFFYPKLKNFISNNIKILK